MKRTSSSKARNARALHVSWCVWSIVVHSKPIPSAVIILRLRKGCHGYSIEEKSESEALYAAMQIHCGRLWTNPPRQNQQTRQNPRRQTLKPPKRNSQLKRGYIHACALNSAYRLIFIGTSRHMLSYMGAGFSRAYNESLFKNRIYRAEKSRITYGIWPFWPRSALLTRYHKVLVFIGVLVGQVDEVCC